MIEYLEARIAPAAVFSYTDIDGDKVKITTTAAAATLSDLTAAVHLSAGGQLNLLDLSNAHFAGTDVTFSVTKAGAGDGLAAVGHINAGTNALGKVTVKGDLADIDANGITSLNVRSMGRYDTDSAGTSVIDEVCTITGALGSLTVAGDVNGVHVKVTGAIGPVTIGGSLIGGHLGGADFGEISSTSKIGAVKIAGSILGSDSSDNGGSISATSIASIAVGGSIIGADAQGGGSITATLGVGAITLGHNLEGGSQPGTGALNVSGVIASLTIKGSVIGGISSGAGEIQIGGATGPISVLHDIRGGSNLDAGEIVSGGKVGNVTIGGSLIGGSSVETGSLYLLGGDAGRITVKQSLIGSTGLNSAEINVGGSVTSIAIGGSLLGGTNSHAGSIDIGNSLTSLTIGHDIVGGSISSGTLSDSGSISADHIGTLTVLGSIIGGLNDGNSTAHLNNNASILAGHDIGSITVKGDIRGSLGSNSAVKFTEILISALGAFSPTGTSDVAIGKIAIGGSVESTTIRAGFTVNSTPNDGQAQIGAVTVGHDWLASNLVAGTKDTANDGFGDGGDSPITPSPGMSISKIASVVIAGIVEGSPTVPDDIYAFEARAIGSFKVHGSAQTVGTGPASAIQLSPITADAFIRLI